MINEIELANKIYLAEKRTSKAFYAHDQQAFTKAREEYLDLTKGMTNKRITKLCDMATICVTLEELK
jgi:predicted transcriptional regulator of viral defense system